MNAFYDGEGASAEHNHMSQPGVDNIDETAEPYSEKAVFAPGSVEANPTVNMFEDPGLEGDAEP